MQTKNPFMEEFAKIRGGTFQDDYEGFAVQTFVGKVQKSDDARGELGGRGTQGRHTPFSEADGLGAFAVNVESTGFAWKREDHAIEVGAKVGRRSYAVSSR